MTCAKGRNGKSALFLTRQSEVYTFHLPVVGRASLARSSGPQHTDCAVFLGTSSTMPWCVKGWADYFPFNTAPNDAHGSLL